MTTKPSPEWLEAVRAHHEAQEDWRGQCRFCGKVLTGTLAALRAHRCPESERHGV